MTEKRVTKTMPFEARPSVKKTKRQNFRPSLLRLLDGDKCHAYSEGLVTYLSNFAMLG